MIFMSFYTTYYNLDKYEGSDRPNLRDQYNSAMDKIDTELHSQDGRLDTVELNASSAIALANAAQVTANAAQADAAAAGTAAAAAQADATQGIADAAAALTAALGSRWTVAYHGTQTGYNSQNEVITQSTQTFRAKTVDPTRDLVITITTGICSNCSTIVDPNNPPIKYTTDINMAVEYPIPYVEVPFETIWGGFANTSSSWITSINSHNTDYAKSHMGLYHCLSASARSNLDLSWRHIAIGLVANS